MAPSTVRVAHVEPMTSAEGPGVRWALWVQGCSLGCAGCCNPHLWDAAGGTPTSVEDLVAAMRTVAGVVEGITLLGGEPFEQAEPLAALAEAARGQGLGVMTFTGYRVEHIRKSERSAWQALLGSTDLLVDGLFLREKLDTTRPWVGSTNQRFIHLSDRYRDAVAIPHDRVEIRVRRDGGVAINGWPEAGLIDSLEDLLNEL